MKSRDCDIVKDLMPSYVDGICSDAAKEYVEEHAKEWTHLKENLKTLVYNFLS